MDSFLDLFKAAGQTAVDIIGAKNSGVTSTNNPAVNPAALAEAARQLEAQKQQTPTNYTPWLIGGGVAVALVVVLVVATRK